MNIQISQLFGIAWYEFQMHWRRRALLVITIAIVGIILAEMLIFGGDITSLVPAFRADTALLNEAQNIRFHTLNVVFITWGAVGAIMAFILPIVVSDSIPLDKQHNVYELFRSLPVSSSIYLAGKILGVWLASLSSMGLSLVVLGIMWWLRVGAFDVFAYLDMWLMGAALIGLLNSALGVLLASTQPSRRRALLLMGGLFILPSLLIPTSTYDISLSGYLNPIRGAVLNFYLNSWARVLNDPTGWTFGWQSTEVWGTLLVGSLQIVVLGLLVWGYLRWQESRA
jgi:ABC-type transport system involved in multi-copper enzyme maturation permease subunit